MKSSRVLCIVAVAALTCVWLAHETATSTREAVLFPSVERNSSNRTQSGHGHGHTPNCLFPSVERNSSNRTQSGHGHGHTPNCYYKRSVKLAYVSNAQAMTVLKSRGRHLFQWEKVLLDIAVDAHSDQEHEFDVRMQLATSFAAMQNISTTKRSRSDILDVIAWASSLQPEREEPYDLAARYLWQIGDIHGCIAHRATRNVDCARGKFRFRYIVVPTEVSVTFVATCVVASVARIGHMLGASVLSPVQMLNNAIPPAESASALYVAEAAYLKRKDKDKPQLDVIRRILPQSTIIVLSGDGCHFIGNGQKAGIEFKNINQADLFCDLQEWVNDRIRKSSDGRIHICKTPWMWTASEFLIDSIRAHIRSRGIRDAWSWHPSSSHAAARTRQLPVIPTKQADVIGLMRMTRSRESVRTELQSKFNYKVIVGGTQNLFTLRQDFDHYLSSVAVWGSSSPSWTSCQTMKGFRDWIGPLLRSVLLYDNYKEVVRAYDRALLYSQNSTAEGMHFWIETLKGEPRFAAKTLSYQIDWAEKNSIDNQLLEMLSPYLNTTSGSRDTIVFTDLVGGPPADSSSFYSIPLV